MKKHIYRAQNVKSIDREKLGTLIAGDRCIFGIDVAKTDMYAVFMNSQRDVILTITWRHPEESPLVLELLTSLSCSSLEIAMEPSGTYGDSFRYQIQQRGIPVYRVSSIRSNKYCEVYDGVPSSHDAKSAAVVARLHSDGMSSPWGAAREQERELRAAILVMDMYDSIYHRLLNQVEAYMSRHWPELLEILELTSASSVELLSEYGSPQAVTANAEKAKKLLLRVSRGSLSPKKIEQVLFTASTTLGVPPLDEECQFLMMLSREANRARKKANQAKKRIEKLSIETPVASELGHAVGKVTGAVLYSYLGDPSDYQNSHAYLKAMGLNVKIRQSGKYKGQLKITKRGSAVVRRYLYLAVLRLLNNDVNFGSWYARKAERDGGLKMKAIVALMRKLGRALWHVGQGNPFESRLLFDARRFAPSRRELVTGSVMT